MTAPATNPLVDDRDVEMLLEEVLDLGRLLRLPYFAEHDRETCRMLIAAARELAREVLYPAYRALDAEPPRLVDGRVLVHPRMRALYARMTELGIVAAPRPHAVGGSALRAAYMAPLYRGEWTGTMALTEPQAGSSLADITTIAEPTGDGHYLVRGAKIFISGGDHDLTDNVVHMTLARIRGAPAGMKGVSLFCCLLYTSDAADER